MLRLNTFSIAARCARTGMFGVGVSTAVPGVGSLCPFAAPGFAALSAAPVALVSAFAYLLAFAHVQPATGSQPPLQ